MIVVIANGVTFMLGSYYVNLLVKENWADYNDSELKILIFSDESSNEINVDFSDYSCYVYKRNRINQTKDERR